MIKKLKIDPVKFIKNKLKSKQKCIWRGKYSYATGCGKEFFDASETGDPVTDWLSFCPYCGGKVEVEQ